MDTDVSVSVTWTGPRTIPGERYSVIEASGSGETYTGSLTISPLAEDQDDGQYTCSVTVSGGSSVLEATNSDSTTIDVIGKDSTTAYSPEENLIFSICMYVCVC